MSRADSWGYLRVRLLFLVPYFFLASPISSSSPISSYFLAVPYFLADHLTGATVRTNQAQRQASMSMKFSEDVVPLADLKVNPGRVVKHAAEAHRPVLLTSRGRGVAVMQSVADYEQAAEERAFMRAVVAGLADLDTGREVSLADAKARFGVA